MHFPDGNCQFRGITARMAPRAPPAPEVILRAEPGSRRIPSIGSAVSPDFTIPSRPGVFFEHLSLEMELTSVIPSVPFCFRRGLLALVMATAATTASAQQRHRRAAPPPVASTQPHAAPVGPVRRISIDEAVTMALEQNVSLQVQKMNPGISELDVVQSYAQLAAQPHRASSGSRASSSRWPRPCSRAAPTSSRTSGSGNFGVDQLLPTGGSYSLGYQALRNENNNQFATLNPNTQGNLTFSFDAAAAAQPLHRHHAPADPGEQEQPRDQRDGLPQHRREHRARRQERVLGSRGGAVGPRRCSGRRWNCRCRRSATTASASRSARWPPSTSCRRKPKWPRTRRT